jgi:hypothetical protein
MMSVSPGSRAIVVGAFVFGLVAGFAVEPAGRGPRSMNRAEAGSHVVVEAGPAAVGSPQTLAGQTSSEADAKSAGCITCHTSTDEASMHPTGTVRLGCADCHGGDASMRVPPGASSADAGYQKAKRSAHPRPRVATRIAGWMSAANPVRAYTDWLRESPEYIQFVNPGDLRVADHACGSCHAAEVQRVRTSMMTHGAMLWGAALYNNGALPEKTPRFGESYSRDGTPQRLQTWPPPTAEETAKKGVLPFLDPIERWEISQPGNVLRVFERGGRKKGEIGNPAREDDPGRPEVKLGERGFGTLLRTDPVFLGLQKTRLFDPLLSFPGTNDQPGDYRGSGCTACHVVYANDRSPAHAAQYAPFGNEGRGTTADPTISKTEPGHPLKHVFTRSIPSSQCMTCHMHPGTNMVTTYYGYTWWENETDGEFMYPKEQRRPSEAFRQAVRVRNPEAAAQRGLWSDVDFLKNVGTPEFNAQLKQTQFADFHSHGWIFRAVYKRDRRGQLLDGDDKVVANDDPQKFSKAVHLQDIHLEKGMQCVDCHFDGDSHGNGKLYGETRTAVEIDCTDCHGTIRNRATLVTSGPAAPAGGSPLERLRTPFGERRFQWRDDRLYQRSMLDASKEWEVVQVLDTITPGASHYSEQSRLAKTIRRDGTTWGSAPAQEDSLAHANSSMTCYTCHTSWTPSCFGCHLSMTANRKMPMLHNEGLTTRNWTEYDFQVLRDDMFMLGRDGTVTGNRIAPVRSACAVIVSSQNQQRDWLYYQQQTVSAEGFSGQSFSTFVPHTVRAKESKRCTDCHVSREKDNNAWMATVLLQGTNFVNQLGRYAWVAVGAGGFLAITVAEREEPPAIFGSHLQKLAYPANYKTFVGAGRQLEEANHHPAANALDIQVRGEYAYVALGRDGFRVYDIANVDNKDFSERITTAPVSPLGQRLFVKTKNAVAVATPTTLGVDPLRTHNPVNEEQRIHLLYGFLYVADAEEGLIVIGNGLKSPNGAGVGTLLDGNPANNFLTRAVTFNPNGLLTGARRIVFAGHYAYVLTSRGLVVVDVDNPLDPRVTAEIDLDDARGIAVQFRYAFVVDRAGLKVLDLTTLDKPRVVGAAVPLEDARNVYTSRTYAYVSGGKQGLVIVDIERPEQPKIDQIFTSGGEINDLRDVKLGMVNASAFAFLADGEHGLRVVQLFSPEDNPNHYGFSPKPTPSLIATYHTHEPALAVSEGVDRDRAVDESGNQLAVFGRRGARPLNLEEQRRLYVRNGQLYTVTNDPPQPAPALTYGETLRRAAAELWTVLVDVVGRVRL